MAVHIKWVDCAAIDGGGTNLDAKVNNTTIFSAHYQPAEVESGIKDLMNRIVPTLNERIEEFRNVEPEKRADV